MNAAIRYMGVAATTLKLVPFLTSQLCRTFECRLRPITEARERRHSKIAAGLAQLTSMPTKSIVAILLLVVVSWAEMAAAPMLVMPGRKSSHNQSVSANHGCCPRMEEGDNTRIAIGSVSMMGMDGHRCCFRQGPQEIPQATRDEYRDSQDIFSPVQDSQPPLSIAISSDLRPARLGMISRV